MSEQTSRPLHDEIYAALRQALILGELRPGERFPMRLLAARFGTSMIPVRDALKRLVAERGLAMLPNRSIVVPKMTRKRFQDLLHVRLSLEPLLARRGAERITLEGIERLTSINQEMQQAVAANDVQKYLQSNYKFHFMLYIAGESEDLLEIVESIWVQIGPFLNAVFTESGTRNARDHHEEILRALRRHDSVAAGSAIGADLGDAADLILAREEFEPEALGQVSVRMRQALLNDDGPQLNFSSMREGKRPLDAMNLEKETP